jgi:hypothetical protein
MTADFVHTAARTAIPAYEWRGILTVSALRVLRANGHL